MPAGPRRERRRSARGRRDAPPEFDEVSRARYDEGSAFRRVAGWSSPVARWAHNPKVGGSNPPPATNITDRTVFQGPALRRGEHRPNVSNNLQQSVAWRNDDLLEEPSQRLAGGVAQIVAFQTGGERRRLLTEDVSHAWVQRRRWRLGEGGRQFGLPRVLRQQFALSQASHRVPDMANCKISSCCRGDGHQLAPRVRQFVRDVHDAGVPVRP